MEFIRFLKRNKSDIQSKETYTSILDGKEWDNFVLRVDVIPGYTNVSGVSRRVNEFRAYICPRITSAKKKICFGMSGTERKFEWFYWLVVKGDSGESHVGWTELETSKGEAVRVKIKVKDGNFIAYVNGMKVNQMYDASFTSGSIGLSQWYYWWDGKKIRTAFDNVEIKPLAD